MKTSLTGGVALVVALAVLVLAFLSFYTVYQTHQALVVSFGNPVRVVTEPGLHVKAPWHSVITVDRRILDLEAQPQELIASDQKRLSVDAFARYRIVDVLKYYQTLGSIESAKSQLNNIMNSALRRVLGEATFQEVVKENRSQLMGRIRDQVDREAESYGISVVDVRIRRADLPEANSQAVYQRMQTERQREAAEFRAQGNQRSQEIRARADRDVTVLLADATATAEKTRGEGDAERNRIFADAYTRDKDFFSFYRSMQAYETAFQHNDTRMLLKPDSEFFRFFVAPSGRSGTAAPASAFPAVPSPAAAPAAPPAPGAAAPQSGATQTQGAAR